jgi:multimeric flavodoxin WrbA
MKMLLICGSPRKGNTEWILQHLNSAAENRGINSTLVLLRKQTIKSCMGCLSCEAGGDNRAGICKTKDAMQELYTYMLQSDIIVMGTPVYFGMLSGQLKTFMDRTCAIWPKLKGKKLAGVAVAEEGISAALDNIKTYADICSMKWAGGFSTLANTRTEVSEDTTMRGKIGQFLDQILSDS